MASITFEIHTNGTGFIKVLAERGERLADNIRNTVNTVLSNTNFNSVTRNVTERRDGRGITINLTNDTTLSQDAALAELISGFLRISQEYELTINLVDTPAIQYIRNIRNYMENRQIRLRYPILIDFLAMQTNSFHNAVEEIVRVLNPLFNRYGSIQPPLSEISVHIAQLPDSILNAVGVGQASRQDIVAGVAEIVAGLTQAMRGAVIHTNAAASPPIEIPTIENYLASLANNSAETINIEKIKKAIRECINRSNNLTNLQCAVTLETLTRDSKVEFFLSKHETRRENQRETQYMVHIYNGDEKSGTTPVSDSLRRNASGPDLIDPNTRGVIIAITKGNLGELFDKFNAQYGLTGSWSLTGLFNRFKSLYSGNSESGNKPRSPNP